jgi:hypothetical protein
MVGVAGLTRMAKAKVLMAVLTEWITVAMSATTREQAPTTRNRLLL